MGLTPAKYWYEESMKRAWYGSNYGSQESIVNSNNEAIDNVEPNLVLEELANLDEKLTEMEEEVCWTKQPYKESSNSSSVQRFVKLFKNLKNLTILGSTCINRNKVGAIAGSDPSKCYKYFMTPKNFDDAEANCVLNSGHLASSTNGFINSFISEMAQGIISDNGAQIWLGYSINSTKWTDGQPFSYNHWAKGEPSLSSGCVAMQVSTSYWYAKSCNTAFPYFCEINASASGASPTPLPITSQPVPFCDSEWTYFAENICVQNGAHLTSIHSTLENSFLVEFAQSGANVAYNDNTWAEWQTWIGLYDQYGNGDFKWTDNSNVDFTNWGPEWPNKEGVGTGVGLTTDDVIDRSGYFQHWFDDSGYQSNVYRAFVCKKAAQLS
uniref:C-type lectin domain-containing protein n=1 Tax=Acrobeloides nanus TaxID=290746 RepID=A0A914EKS6_9BILA